MKVLVTGALGQLGTELCRRLGDDAVPLDLPELDITSRSAVLEKIVPIRPRAIINCAAYTAVDAAESNADICEAVNATAVAHLADAARQVDCPIMQISTDYVFAGNQHRTPLTESDPTSPQGVYAHSKLRGEHHAAAWEKHFVVRTCGLYGPSSHGKNFVETMLRPARERDRIGVVDDQFCTPTYVVDLASALLFLIASQDYGTYHVVNGGKTTWHEFAAETFRIAACDVVVDRISTSQYNAPAPRPAYSVLNTDKYHAAGGPTMPPWQDALARYIAARS